NLQGNRPAHDSAPISARGRCHHSPEPAGRVRVGAALSRSSQRADHDQFLCRAGKYSGKRDLRQDRDGTPGRCVGGGRMTVGTDIPIGQSARERPRSLLVHEWPDADQRAWQDACRPGSRLKPGGSASYLAPVSRDSFARRYGAFLAFLKRNGRLEQYAAAAAQVTTANVAAYIDELTARVRSVTTYNCIYHLRRAAELLAPTIDFSWLAEIEKDLALGMEPRSKSDRLVLARRLGCARLGFGCGA